LVILILRIFFAIFTSPLIEMNGITDSEQFKMQWLNEYLFIRVVHSTVYTKFGFQSIGHGKSIPVLIGIQTIHRKYADMIAIF